MNSNGNLTGKVIPLVIKEKSSSSAMEGNNILKRYLKNSKRISIYLIIRLIFDYYLNLLI